MNEDSDRNRASSPYSSSSSSSSSTTRLDHEKLDVYQLELQFVGWATDLMVDLDGTPAACQRRIGEVFDHLDRAALSMLFNTAEGNGKRQMKWRARFFDDARGSATECAGCLDALVAKQACVGSRIEAGKRLLVRIVSMLTKLVQRFSSATDVREHNAVYRIRQRDGQKRSSRSRTRTTTRTIRT
jgi:four helix bundle protein